VEVTEKKVVNSDLVLDEKNQDQAIGTTNSKQKHVAKKKKGEKVDEDEVKLNNLISSKMDESNKIENRKREDNRGYNKQGGKGRSYHDDKQKS